MSDKNRQAEIVELKYRNSERPRLDVEALRLSDVRRWLPEPVITAPYRIGYHEIILITAGRGSASIDLEERECRRGTLLHVRPGQIRTLPRPVGQRAPLEARIVLFTPSFPVQRPILHGPLQRPIGSGCWELDEPTYGRFDHSIGELDREYRHAGDQPRDAELLRHLLSIVLIRVNGLEPPNITAATSSTAFARFQAELERSFVSTRAVADYAHKLGYSDKTFSRASRAATGRTTKQLINARVVLEAQRLLTHTDLPAAEIAGRLGFAQASNFQKFFTRESGESPGAFRNARSV